MRGLFRSHTALSSPALARDGRWYVECLSGVTVPDNLNFDVGSDYSSEADFGLAGYDFSSARSQRGNR